MVRLTPSSDSVLMGHRIVRLLEKHASSGTHFLKELLETTCDNEKLSLVVSEA